MSAKRGADLTHHHCSRADMTKRIKAILRGVGSVIDLAPGPRGDRFVPRGTDTERLRADFARVGEDMQRVFERETRAAEAPGADQS